MRNLPLGSRSTRRRSLLDAQIIPHENGFEHNAALGERFGGALAAIVIITLGLDGGFGEILETASAHDKLRLVDFDFNLATDGILVLLLAALFANLIPYTSDQAVVQRDLPMATVESAVSAVLA